MENNIDKAYTDLLQDILDNGVTKQDRTGTGTISVFGRQIRHDMKTGFPLLTTKKMAWKQIVTELLWFLRGDTNVKWLFEQDNYIWLGDVYKNYCEKINLPPTRTLPLGTKVIPTLYTQEEFINKIKTDDEFAKKWGDLGPVYGKQWRGWKYIKEGGYLLKNGNEGKGTTTKYTDQIQNLINDLKTNPDSRRLMVNAWNVGELDQMVLPPCHYGFQVYTRELTYEERRKLFEEKTNRDSTYILSVRETLDKFQIPTRAISLMWNQRSVDTFLGLPFNIASYGLLLEIIAKEVNMVPDELIGNLGDTHLYNNHIEQAKEQIGQPIFEESPMLYPNGPMNEGIKKQIMVGHTRKPYPLPTLKIEHSSLDPVELVYKLGNYQSHPTIKAPLSN